MVASTANHPRDDQSTWTPERAHALVRSTLSRIDSFADLDADWDSYGAAPSAPVARAEAQRWIEIVASLFAPRFSDLARPFSVAPLANGGVQIEWRGAESSVELEVGPDGSLGYLLTEGHGEAARYQEADDASWSDILRLLIRIFTPETSDAARG